MSHRKRGPAAASGAGFTLLELLIVLMIVAILMSLLLPVVIRAQENARVGVARSQIASIKGALAMYSADTGRLPRRPGTPATADALFRNDIAYLYAALLNNRSTRVGGGPAANYLERNHSMIALAAAADIDNNAFMSVNPTDMRGAYWVNPLPTEDRDALNDTSYQAAHLPGTASQLVLVDPWGNPYIYREWASIPNAQKDGLAIKRTFQLAPSGSVESVIDRPHDPSGYDLISVGKNGILEYGAGDDICSWQVQK
jgi:prepilin-type N-terminal cleavage/methylation domain-containing protein